MKLSSNVARWIIPSSSTSATIAGSVSVNSTPELTDEDTRPTTEKPVGAEDTANHMVPMESENYVNAASPQQ